MSYKIGLIASEGVLTQLVQSAQSGYIANIFQPMKKSAIKKRKSNFLSMKTYFDKEAFKQNDELENVLYLCTLQQAFMHAIPYSVQIQKVYHKHGVEPLALVSVTKRCFQWHGNHLSLDQSTAW